MTAILGIDPGLSGALALYRPSQLIVWDIPVLTIERNGKARRDTDLHQLLALFRIAKREGATAVLEQINAQPGNGLFRQYEAHHRAKDEPGRLLKAERNGAIADRIEKLLGLVVEAGGCAPDIVVGSIQ